MACIHFPLTKNKSFELQLELFNDLSCNNIIELSFNWSIKQDHAGLSYTFMLYRIIFFKLQIYDNRHWDWENNKWEEYNENN